MRRNQNGLERHAHALLERIAILLGHVDEANQAVDLVIGNGTPVSAAGQRGHDQARALRPVLARARGRR